MKRIALALVLASSALVLAFDAGCGPSFQAIYEGDANFEHCYMLDDTPNKPMPEKSACWRDWSLHYTYGQTRDRVEYAAARYRALSRVNGAPTDEALMQAAPGEGSDVRSSGAPSPTNAFAPPPQTLARDAGLAGFDAADMANVPGAAAVTAPMSVPSPPGADCSEACARSWRACGVDCVGDVCTKCQKSYKTCMKSCFKASL